MLLLSGSTPIRDELQCWRQRCYCRICKRPKTKGQSPIRSSGKAAGPVRAEANHISAAAWLSPAFPLKCLTAGSIMGRSTSSMSSAMKLPRSHTMVKRAPIARTSTFSHALPVSPATSAGTPCAGQDLCCTDLTEVPVRIRAQTLTKRLFMGPAITPCCSCRLNSLSDLLPISGRQACLHHPDDQAAAQAEDGVPAHTLRMLRPWGVRPRWRPGQRVLVWPLPVAAHGPEPGPSPGAAAWQVAVPVLPGTS